MKLSDEISVLCDSLGNYAQRRSDEDTANAKYQGFLGQLMNAYVAVNSAGSFETPEIISIEEDKLQEFYDDKPELKLYKRALDKLRRKKAHILSEAEEKILALTGEMGQSPEIYTLCFLTLTCVSLTLWIRTARLIRSHTEAISHWCRARTEY